ncbi:MAG: hypothetical protein RID09_09845 [Coleofasciculus sp. G1-WW12-02]
MQRLYHKMRLNRYGDCYTNIFLVTPRYNQTRPDNVFAISYL